MTTFIEKIKSTVIITEENDYTSIVAKAAKYSLLEQGIDNPSAEQVSKEANYLSCPETRPSIVLGERLTDREIETLYWIMCGEKISDIAARFGVSRIKITQLRKSILEKLCARNFAQAVYCATRLGYFPWHGCLKRIS